jgi:hypothetical protein
MPSERDAVRSDHAEEGRGTPGPTEAEYWRARAANIEPYDPHAGPSA